MGIKKFSARKHPGGAASPNVNLGHPNKVLEIES